jgi:Sulfotransferase domain
VRAPDFVGLGVQSSGTTWWLELVRDHPGVATYGGPDKELRFFEQFWDGRFGAEDVQRYHRYFPRPQGKLTGEWTSDYTRDVWTARLLAAAAPKAKLLVILRDPVERYAAGLGRDLWVARSRSKTIGPHSWTHALRLSSYASQLARVLEHFAREQLLVLQYERCCADPTTELERTYAFLGLDPRHVPADLTRRRGEPLGRADLATELRAELVAALEPEVRGVSEAFPEIDLDLWPNFAWLAQEREGAPT